MAYFNIGDTNLLWHKDLPITEETYQPLWNAAWYRIDHEARTVRYLPDWETGEGLTKAPSADKLMEFTF